ncbi:myo-inosose-2 dehydratase [Stigmatella sp. ncwal1]|uniref:Myo-inosose-2 dehydratase n=1 Tax=Stigmatella ashevillensis TaxID=2995309 RepID=A0ABT5D9C8_9BACT|nr:myo-inosose-2 dehydratase [Stigmatella ashevillena]MDC0710273.1 myo-inosose-2 dehydratase [Stigmatella ashevillena]
MRKGLEVTVGAQPINWCNDDFRDLGASITLDQCLSEMRQAGYVGTELGHRFPQDGASIRALLETFGLQLASGWHSTFLASKPYTEEEASFDAHVARLRAAGSRVVIVAECTGAIHSDGSKPLRFASGADLLDASAWERVYEGLDRLSSRAAAVGMKVAYHPHMGTVIQDQRDVDRLMERTKGLSLLLDTGHLAFAGADPLAVLRDHGPRVAHVHLKNIRPAVVEQARTKRLSFEAAVRAGAFTVPGDGGIDFKPLFEHLATLGYSGWWIVEAEQDPGKANPLMYALMGRRYIREIAGV